MVVNRISVAVVEQLMYIYTCSGIYLHFSVRLSDSPILNDTEVIKSALYEVSLLREPRFYFCFTRREFSPFTAPCAKMV